MSPITAQKRLAPLLLVALLAPLGCDEGTSRAAEPSGHDGQHADKHETHAGDHEGHSGGHESHSGGHEGHSEGPEGVAIPHESLAEYGIQVSGLQTGRLTDMVTAPAKVKHNVEKVAHITPLVKGQIDSLHVSLGDQVKRGQTVARMRSVELGNARADVEQAKSSVEVAQSNFDRQKKLKELEISSERDFIEAKGELKEAEARLQAARARLATFGVRGGSGPTYPLRSKISGTVIEQHASLGETKNSNDALFVVADHSDVWVIGEVSEKALPRVEPGMEALVTLDAYPDRNWSGTVDWIASTVDEKTRTLPVRVELENPDKTLKPGMFGTLQLKPSKVANPLPLVPVDAVQKVHGNDVVFAPGDKKGHFKPKKVELGTEAEGLIEVTGGLEADAEIVTAGAFDLKAALTAQGRSAAHSH